MVIDTSALVSIVLAESTRQILKDEIERAKVRTVSAVSLLESGIVLSPRGSAAARALLFALIDDLRITVVPFDDAQARLAIDAFARYGRAWATKHNSTSATARCAHWRNCAVNRSSP